MSSRSLNYQKFHKRQNYRIDIVWDTFKKTANKKKAQTFWVERHLDVVLEVLKVVG